MTTWQENIGKGVENTKGSSSTFTGIGKDGASRDSWRFKGEVYESAEVKEKSCKQVHLLLLTAVLKGVLPDFPVPSVLGSHINHYKVTVKRKHSKLVLFLMSCATQKCRAAGSLALKFTFCFCVIFRLLTEPLLPAKLPYFSKILSSVCSMAEEVLKLHKSHAWKERRCTSIEAAGCFLPATRIKDNQRVKTC